MIIEFHNGSWRLATKKVTFTNGDDEQVLYTADTTWIEQTAELHEHINISKTEDVTFTEEQQARFTEITNMPEDFGNIYSEFVETGKVEGAANLRAGHPFNTIYLRESKRATEIALTEAEIQLMEQADTIAKQGDALNQAELALTDKDIADIERDLALTDLEIRMAEVEAALQP